jgi:hypothetical protein
MERKQEVLLHLKQPEQGLLDNYYNNILTQLNNELTFNFVNSQGRDISDVIRGKIFMVKDLLSLKDRLEKIVKEGAKN